MKLESLEYLRCPHVADAFSGEACGGTLGLSPAFAGVVYGKHEGEVLQGMLRCEHCGAQYPVVAGVAILVSDVTEYLAGNFGAIMQAVEGLPEGERGCTSLMRQMLRVMGGARCRTEAPDEYLDVYLPAHYPVGGVGRSTLLDTAMEFYQGDSFYERQKDMVLREMGLCEAACTNALDAGCSVGGMAWRLQTGFTRVLGVDMSFAAVLYARRAMLGEPAPLGTVMLESEPGVFDYPVEMPNLKTEGVECVVASAMALPVCSSWADCMTSINLIDVLPDPAMHLKEVSRVLTDNGLYHLCDPYCWDEDTLKTIVERFGSSDSYVEQLLLGAGFETILTADVPWALQVNSRQANLYLCRCMAARRK